MVEKSVLNIAARLVSIVQRPFKIRPLTLSQSIGGKNVLDMPSA
jgi:hypothetical protein